MAFYRPISRRELVVSTAAGVFLKPWVDCLQARAEGPALRPAFFTMLKGQAQYGGDGSASASARNWIPRMNGGDLELAPLVAPFERVKKHLTFVVGLDIATSPTDWHWSIPSLFTGFDSRPGGPKTVPTNESLDWYVARRMGPATNEPLVINLYGRWLQTGGLGSQTSWGRGPDGKMFRKAPTYDPITLFKEVFGEDAVPSLGAATDEKRVVATQRARRSMLDAVRADAESLKLRAGAAHKVQIDTTLDSIRELEVELIGKDGKPSPQMDLRCAPMETLVASEEKVLDSLETFERGFRGLTDVLLAALRCGRRNVFHFGFLDLDCQRFVPAKIKPEWKSLQKGVTPYHFDHTHFPFGKPWIECEQYLYGFYARMLEGMMAIPANGSNLLEQSLGVFATTMSHNHSSHAASYFVAGNAGGKVKSNRILTFGDPTRNAATGRPHNDLLVSVLQGFGFSDVKSYGEAKYCRGGLSGFL